MSKTLVKNRNVFNREKIMCCSSVFVLPFKEQQKATTTNIGVGNTDFDNVRNLIVNNSMLSKFYGKTTLLDNWKHFVFNSNSFTTAHEFLIQQIVNSYDNFHFVEYFDIQRNNLITKYCDDYDKSKLNLTSKDYFNIFRHNFKGSFIDGYLTTHNRWVNKTEAYRIAFYAGQLQDLLYEDTDNPWHYDVPNGKLELEPIMIF